MLGRVLCATREGRGFLGFVRDNRLESPPASYGRRTPGGKIGKSFSVCAEEDASLFLSLRAGSINPVCRQYLECLAIYAVFQ